MENETVKVQDVKEDTTTTASEEEQVVDKIWKNSVPYARFNELVAEKNELKSQLDSINKQMKADTEATKVKQMEDKGEYDKIMSDMTLKRKQLRLMIIRPIGEIRYYLSCQKMIVRYTMDYP